MWWYKIPVLLVVAAANHISLSDQKIAKLRSRSLFIRVLLLVFRAFFWTLTACEVALICSVNHLRSPVAHRILVVIVHPWANFPPRPHISLSFAIGWSISVLSLIIHLIFKSYYRRIRQSSTSFDQGHHVLGRRIQTTRRIVHGSNPVMAVGSTSCYIVPGSFAYECWVWRMGFGGVFFCLVGVFYLVFWLVMAIWRCVRSRRGGGTVTESVGGIPSSDASLEGGTETLAVEELD